MSHPNLLVDEVSVPEQRCTSQSNWYGIEEAVVGLAHRQNQLPCQDAARCAVRGHRALLVVADGAGSAPVSDIGSNTIVTSTYRLLDTLENQIVELLDQPKMPTPEQVRRFALLVVKHARGGLSDLAQQHRRAASDFRCTLLVVVAGLQHGLWLKVGDGAIVLEEMVAHKTDDILNACSELTVVGETGKGEFANVTTFLDSVQLDQVQYGIFPTKFITAIAVMTDGAAEKLVANDGRKASPRLSSWFAALRQEKLARPALTRAFYTDDFCMNTSCDDRGIALAASPFALPSLTPPPVVKNPASPSKSNKIRIFLNKKKQRRSKKKRR